MDHLNKKFVERDEQILNQDLSYLNLGNSLKTIGSPGLVDRTVRYEFHHKLKTSSGFEMEIVLTEDSITNLMADCIVNHFKIDSYDKTQHLIKLKAGSDYEFELNRSANGFARNSKNNASFLRL